ncbi:DUF3413 domain-containing protein [Psychromonas sp. PT13]|uniref:DUF3413 domain-containing protein n=1 Tax=Psychromonas sp. PT13 TaxID=3439547 RepID=UPI003EBA0D23
MVETGNKFHDKVSRLIGWGHWFTLFNLIIVSLISLRYIKYSGLSDSGLGIAYQFISLIGHFSFVSAVFFGIILFPLAFAIPSQRIYRITVSLISALLISFLILDTQIFKLYNFHLNPLLWQFLQQPEQVEEIYSIRLHYISIPILFIIELFISAYIWKKQRFLQAKSVGKPIVTFLLSTFLLTHLVFIWADATEYRPITQEKSIYPLSYPMTARTFLKEQGWLNDVQLFEHINKQNPNKVSGINYPKEPLTFNTIHSSTTDKNILLLTVDALRADMLNTDNMPFLSQLSQQGITFKNHFSGASTREQGIFSLFYGLPNRYWFDMTLNFIPPVLVNRLVQEQYQFGLFSSIGFLHPEFLQSSFSQIETEELQHFSAKNNDQLTTQKWQAWLSKQSKDHHLFSFLYYGQLEQSIYKESDRQTLADRSDNMTHYQQQVLAVDQQIKEVIATLQQNGQLANTIVIITGTHAASFKKTSNIESAISDAHVPLVMLWPGKQPAVINRMTSHVDIVPTLMQNVLGTTTTADQYSIGQDLFNPNERQYLLSGDLDNYIIYQNDKITQFSNRGEINSINWQGDSLDEDNVDVTLLIDVLSKMRRFNNN